MRTLRVGLALLSGTLVALAFSGTTEAFHSGGVAECAGCHSMHPAAKKAFLLVGSDQSSTCLTCHESSTDTAANGYHISTADAKLTTGNAPLQRTPGGDFGWLKKTYTYTYSGTTYNEDGATHGHNIVAADKSYVADTTNATAPGGTFASANLACNSCHDPHGQFRRLDTGVIAKTGAPIIGSGSYDTSTEPTAGKAVGVYRLLAGAGYTRNGVTFSGVPAAKAPSTYNRTEATTQTRTAYGVATSGGHETWGDWCATCHPDMHKSDGSVHPVDQNMGSTVNGLYNSYVKSGDLTGTSASSFSSLVPFIEGTDAYATLASHAKNNDSVLAGPTTGDQVSCLSCHRAHASGMMYGLRFDIEYEFMTKEGDYVGSDNPAVTGSRAAAQHRGRTVAEWKAAYYDRPATQFASYQRVLCNKCHAKD
jgi:predicted CXXCH cytochrome family protein